MNTGTDAGVVTAGTNGQVAPSLTDASDFFSAGKSAQAVGSGLYLMGGTLNLQVDSTTSIAGGIGEYHPVVLTKTGNGTLILAGTNTYTGGTTISAGTLQIGNGGTTGSLAGNIANSGTLVFNRDGAATFAGVISGSGSLVNNGPGAVTLSGNNTLSGGLTVNAGSLEFSGNNTIGSLSVTGGTLVLSGSTVVNGPSSLSGNSTISGPTTFNSTVAFNGNHTVSGAATFANSITLNGGSLVLSGANTLASTVTVNGGTLGLGNDLALGNGAQSLVINGGAVVDLYVAHSIANPLTVAGSFFLGRLTTFSGAVTLTSDITITSTNPDTLASGPSTFSGSIGGAHSLTFTEGVNPTGTIYLSGANTYTGGTTLASGTVSINSAASLGAASSPLTFNGGALDLSSAVGGTRPVAVLTEGGTLQTNGNSASFGALSGSGALNLLGGGAVAIADPTSFTGSLALSGGTLSVTGGSLALNTLSGSGSLIADGVLTWNSASDVTFGGISVTGNGSLTKSGAGTLSLASNFSLAGPVTLNSGTLRVTNGAFVSLSSAIGGAGGLSIDSGTVVLGSANTYTGGTVLTGGDLQLNAAGALPGALTLGGGVLEIGDDQALQNNSGALTVNGGAIRASGAPRTVANDLVINSASFGVGRSTTFNGNVTLNADLTLSPYNLDGAADFSSSFNGAIGGAHSLTIADGTGIGSGAIVLAGANTYSGGTIVSHSTLGIASDASLGSGSLTLDGGTVKAFGAISSSRTLALTSAGGSWNTNGFNSIIEAVSGAGNFTVLGGSGSLQLTGSSTVGGSLTLKGGLTLANAASFASSSVLVVNNFNNRGALTIQGDSGSRGVLSTAQVSGAALGTVTLDGGILRATAGNGAFIANFAAGNLILASGGGFIDSNGFNIGTSNGFSGAGGLTKTGSGTFSLTGAQTYTGPTNVNGGELKLNASAASSAFTIHSGGTLSGNGTVGPLTIASGGTLSPGNSPGTMNAGNTTFAGGGAFAWQINSTVGGAGQNPGWDLLNVSGSLTITATSSNKFTVSLQSLTLGDATGQVSDFDPTATYSFNFVTTTGGITGFDPSEFTLDASGFQNSFGGTWSVVQSGNNLALDYTGASGGGGGGAVPEPSTYAAVTGACALAASWWRRRRR